MKSLRHYCLLFLAVLLFSVVLTANGRADYPASAEIPPPQGAAPYPYGDQTLSENSSDVAPQSASSAKYEWFLTFVLLAFLVYAGVVNYRINTRIDTLEAWSGLSSDSRNTLLKRLSWQQTLTESQLTRAFLPDLLLPYGLTRLSFASETAQELRSSLALAAAQSLLADPQEKLLWALSSPSRRALSLSLAHHFLEETARQGETPEAAATAVEENSSELALEPLWKCCLSDHRLKGLEESLFFAPQNLSIAALRRILAELQEPGAKVTVLVDSAALGLDRAEQSEAIPIRLWQEIAALASDYQAAIVVFTNELTVCPISLADNYVELSLEVLESGGRLQGIAHYAEGRTAPLSAFWKPPVSGGRERRD